MLHAGHSRTWRKLDHDPKAVAGKAIEWFRMAEKTASVRSCEMPVIFVPQAMKILLIALNLGWNGKNVFLKTSPLAGKLGRRIADERLSITDNPLVDFAGVSGSRDGEGVPHRVTPLIEKGVLKTFLYDLDTAGRAGTESTGHGPGCGTTNLVIAPGDTSFEEMVKSTKEGLLVRSVLGLGQGNTISGEFSVNLHLGYKIENGEIVGRVKNAMLAGNTYDALRQIDSIGNQPEWVGDSLYTPPFKIEKLSVVAS
jgi:PmbA protein